VNNPLPQFIKPLIPNIYINVAIAKNGTNGTILSFAISDGTFAKIGRLGNTCLETIEGNPR